MVKQVMNTEDYSKKKIMEKRDQRLESLFERGGDTEDEA